MAEYIFIKALPNYIFIFGGFLKHLLILLC